MRAARLAVLLVHGNDAHLRARHLVAFLASLKEVKK